MFKILRINEFDGSWNNFEEVEKAPRINWIATDEDGSVYTYLMKPSLSNDEFWHAQRHDKDMFLVTTIVYTGDWKDSLRYVGDK